MGKLPHMLVRTDLQRQRGPSSTQIYQANDRSYRFWKKEKWLRLLLSGRDFPNLLLKPQESPGLSGIFWAVSKICLSRTNIREFCFLPQGAAPADRVVRKDPRTKAKGHVFEVHVYPSHLDCKIFALSEEAFICDTVCKLLYDHLLVLLGKSVPVWSYPLTTGYLVLDPRSLVHCFSYFHLYSHLVCLFLYTFVHHPPIAVGQWSSTL